MISFRRNSGPRGKNLGMTFCIARQHFVPVAQYESSILNNLRCTVVPIVFEGKFAAWD